MLVNVNGKCATKDRLRMLACVICVGVLSVTVRAQQALTLEKDVQAPAAARDPEGYWSPERLQGAQALDVQLSEISAANTPELEALLDSRDIHIAAEGQEFEDGANPVESFEPDMSDVLFTASESTEAVVASSSDIVPMDEGTMRAPFSSSRVPPSCNRMHYPYRTTGRLFFRTNSGRDSWCSAAVLRPGIILTAGHCVHQGSGGSRGWHSRWLFVPAYENGHAPYQAWNWRWVVVTGSWANSGGRVPNKADFAIIELEKRRFGSQTKRIGQVVGWLGWHINILQRNHVKLLGYPGNHDRGRVMHQVDAGSWRLGGQNTMLYGSDMRGGSSGGPWIMNFGTRAAGQTGGLRPWRDRIVGVTSYGYIATGPKVQGSSILNREFFDILRLACNRPGNCQ